MTNTPINVSSVMNSLIPITRFNRGEANKIFDEVNENGFKIVVKNNKPICVLITPERYEEMLDIIEDYQLLFEAQKRMENFDESKCLSSDQVMKELGITEADLDAAEAEIDIE